MRAYAITPEQFFKVLVSAIQADDKNLETTLCCAGFEMGRWRATQLATHLMEWLPEYALTSEELDLITHANAYNSLREAAVRVYTSEKYSKRGEVGEIALHAICRHFFQTTPISPRVFYKSASNDVIKSFDMVHACFRDDQKPQIWLGESKIYEDSSDAIADALKSVRNHLDHDFLKTQKLILGPQLPRTSPHYEELRRLLSSQESLDSLISSAVFVIGIAANSKAVSSAKTSDNNYVAGVTAEINLLINKVKQSGLSATIRVLLIYLPLLDKADLLRKFDDKLKALTR